MVNEMWESTVWEMGCHASNRGFDDVAVSRKSGTLSTLWRVFSTAERLTVPSTARVALAKSAQVPHSAESLLRGGQ